MMTVTVEEARDRLPELLAAVAKGDSVVIISNRKSIATLSGPPQYPVTPEERAEHQLKCEAIVREWTAEMQTHLNNPQGPGFTLDELICESRED